MNALMEDVTDDRTKRNRKVEVVDRQTLNSSHIKKLARGEYMILHVRGFLEPQACKLIASGAVELGYITLSAFFGYRGKERNLTVWS